MRILYLTQWFEPEPVFKGMDFAKGLAAEGLTVTVVTGFPNYPVGKLYPQYRMRWCSTEQHDGITVKRLPLYPSHDRSVVRRALNYISFAASATVYCLAVGHRWDVIYVYHPPLTAALAGVISGWVRRRPVIVDVQDLWPDSLTATGMMRRGWGTRMLGALAGFVYRRARFLIVQSEGFGKVLRRRGVPAEKILTIYNWADESAVAVSSAANGNVPALSKQHFNVMFAGTIGLAQGLDAVLDAAKLLADRAPHVRFVLAGDGADLPRLRHRILQEAIGNVELIGAVPRSEVAKLLQQADALLVSLKADPLFSVTVPSKTQFYLASGKPILIAATGEAAHLVEAAGAGIAVAPGDGAALAEAAMQLASMSSDERAAMGDSGARYYRRFFARAEAMKRTAAVVRSCARANVSAQPSTAT